EKETDGGLVRCLFCQEKSGHKENCFKSIKQPYSTGFILKQASILSDDNFLYLFNHLLTVECKICFISISGDKMMILFHCWHTACFQCLMNMKEARFKICPFCKEEIFSIYPLMQVPEAFSENFRVDKSVKLGNEEDLNFYVDIHTGEIDVIEEKRELYQQQVYVNI
ncbi:hypothetical protein B4U79_16682, partial [Dinothrombium tinctorium]